MTNEYDTLQKTPVLTLEPFAEEKKVPEVVEEKEEVLDETILTAEEKEAVENFASQIDLTNSSLILQYGAGTQRKMADFSENFYILLIFSFFDIFLHFPCFFCFYHNFTKHLFQITLKIA